MKAVINTSSGGEPDCIGDGESRDQSPRGQIIGYVEVVIGVVPVSSPCAVAVPGGIVQVGPIFHDKVGVTNIGCRNRCWKALWTTGGRNESNCRAGVSIFKKDGEGIIQTESTQIA